MTQSIDGLQTGKISGTIWKGSIEARYQELPVSRISWNTLPLHLIFGRINLELSINASGLEGNSDLSLSGESVKLSDLKLEIESSFINEVTRPLGLGLSESFTITSSEIYVSDNWFSQITGEIVWPGGSIEIDTPIERLRIQLPPLSGIVKMKNKEAKLYVYLNSKELMILSLARSGWAKAEINHLFFEQTEMSFPGTDSEIKKDPAITIEEKIL